jgi:very-short-patch-repair endonuclease
VAHRYVDQRSRRNARGLRADGTAAEIMLWRDLRGSRLGVKFRRQVAIGPYIADFACFDARLIVELDGRPHERPEQEAHDRKRDAWLNAQGYRVLRIPNDLVLGGSGQLALDRIREALVRDPSSDPC